MSIGGEYPKDLPSEPKVWAYMVGGYQVLDKWLKDRKKAGRTLDIDDWKHYMKIVVRDINFFQNLLTDF